MIQIFLVIVAMQSLVTNGNPLFQGISFQRGFEIHFKPLPKERLAFLKETWSPFGVFGKKFAIEKRSIDDIVPLTEKPPRPAAPVFEHIEEMEHIGTEPLLSLPKPLHRPLPIPMPIIVNDYPPLQPKSQVVPPISTNMVIIQPSRVVNNHMIPVGLYTDISRAEAVKEHINVAPHSAPLKEPVPSSPVPRVVPVEAKPVPITPAKVPPVAIVAKPLVEPASPPAVVVPVVPVPPLPVEPSHPSPPPSVAIPAVPISPPPVEPVPPAPLVAIPVVPVSSPPTVAIPVVPIPLEPIPPKPPVPIPPKEPEPLPPKPVTDVEEKKPVDSEIPKKEIALKDSSFVKGSKMALQFGTVFLTLMAQFLDSARASIDIMTNPPPLFRN